MATVAEAEELLPHIDDSGDKGIRPDAQGKDRDSPVAPRHHQFPHAFSEQGLVITDTPGLNAIGAEPELRPSTCCPTPARYCSSSPPTHRRHPETIWRCGASTSMPDAASAAHRRPQQDRRAVGRPAQPGRDRARDCRPGGQRRQHPRDRPVPGLPGVSAQKGTGRQGERRRRAAGAQPPRRSRARPVHRSSTSTKRDIVRDSTHGDVARRRPAVRAGSSTRAWAACASSSRNSPTCAARTRTSSNT